MLLSKSALTLAFALTLALASPAPAEAEAIELPDTPAGRVASEFFAAFNSGDDAALLEFEQSNRHPDGLAERSAQERAAQYVAVHAQIGDLLPGAILEDTPTLVRVAARAENIPIWFELRYEVESEPPHRILSSRLQNSAPPAQEITIDDAWSDLADLLERVRSESGVPAIAAAIIEEGELVDRAVVGVRTVNTTELAQLDDRFHMGSITKSMTATMIANLVEQGVLRWDMTIAEGLPGLDTREEYKRATLENLLHHRAGVPPYTLFTDEQEALFDGLTGSAREQREFLISRALNEEPIAAVDTTMNYSNAGYTIAGVIAERATDQTWESLMQTFVFEPAGMTRAGFGWPATESNPDQPRGHFTQDDGSLRPRDWGEYPLGDYLAPAGGVHCSITDLSRYAQLHLASLQDEGSTLNVKTLERLHTPPVHSDEGEGYAAGWRVRQTSDLGAVHEHSGSAGTFFATIELYPEIDSAIVIAMNIGLEGQALSQAISEMARARFDAPSD